MALGNSEKIGEAFVEVRADLSQMKKDFNKLKSNAGRTTKKVEGQFKKMTNGIKSSFASTLVSGAKRYKLL